MSIFQHLDYPKGYPQTTTQKATARRRALRSKSPLTHGEQDAIRDAEMRRTRRHIQAD